MSSDAQNTDAAPKEGVLALFFRFLKFGLLAWGGPVAQIDMVRKELVEKERWISPERFNRVLAVYQALPGPEATELCLYFGMLAGGRLGGVAAGLGFLLPGALLMFGLTAVYAAHGSNSVALTAAFFGMQPAMLALVASGLVGIGRRALSDRYLAVIACLAGFAQLAQAHFALILAVSGICGTLFHRGRRTAALLAAGILLVGSALWSAETSSGAATPKIAQPTPAAMTVAGLKAGSLTFGGAYMAIPFVREDAVRNGWVTDTEFLDGLALAGILPAPLIIFAMFTGFLAAGPTGAMCMTLGIFLPAFAFTLLGHKRLEKCVDNPMLHGFLDGVTAGVVGITVATMLWLAQGPLSDPAGALIFLLVFSLLRIFKSRWAIPLLMAVSAVIGLVIF